MGSGRYNDYGATCLVFEETSGVGLENNDDHHVNVIQGMQIFGPGLDGAPANANTTGIQFGSAYNLVVRDVLLNGWGIGANYYATTGHHDTSSSITATATACSCASAIVSSLAFPITGTLSLAAASTWAPMAGRQHRPRR